MTSRRESEAGDSAGTVRGEATAGDRHQGPHAPSVAVAVVGTLVPDVPAFHGPAFNRAGQMFQASLVRGLIKAELPVTSILRRQLLRARR